MAIVHREEDVASVNVHREDPLASVPPPPPTPNAAVVNRSRVRRRDGGDSASSSSSSSSSSRRRLDRDRPIEVLAVLFAYVIVVHYGMKFVSFAILPPPDDASSGRSSGGGSSGLRRAVSRSGDVASTAAMGARAWDASTIAWANSISGGRRRAGGGRGAFQSRHGDDSGRRERCANCIIVPASHKRYGRSVEDHDDDGGGVVLDASVVERRDDDVVDGGIVSNATSTTNERKVERVRDRIPVSSYRDEYVIISKPCGMTMHRDADSRGRRGRSRGGSKSPVLQTAIRRQLGRRPYLVHRLDHRTSGACLVGFTSGTASELHGRLRDVDATKLYVALVRGDLRERFRIAATACRCDVPDRDDAGGYDDRDGCDDGDIVYRSGRIPDVVAGDGAGRRPVDGSTRADDDEYRGFITVNLPIKVRMGGDVEVTKDASTDFYFLSSIAAANGNEDETRSLSTTRYVNKSLTLLMCHPRTGRTHQIRKHLRMGLASPVIGDVEHGDSRVNRHWRETIGLDRLGLHCWYLELPPPPSSPPSPSPSLSLSSSSDDRDIITCVAPLTLDFARALRHKRLESLWAEALRVEPRLGMEPYDERGGTFGRNYRKR